MFAKGVARPGSGHSLNVARGWRAGPLFLPEPKMKVVKPARTKVAKKMKKGFANPRAYKPKKWQYRLQRYKK